MNLGLTGRSFVVCGASRGLGRAVASELVNDGARVLLVARTERALRETGTALRAAAILTADLSQAGAAAAVASHAQTELGRLDGLLINGGGPPPGGALELSDEAWRSSFEQLIAGPLRLLRALLPLMADSGSIVFMTSSAVRQPIPGLDASNVLRPGIAALVKCLARELAPKIRVNAVAPGRFDTARVRMLDERRAAAAGISLAEQSQRVIATIPLGRYGEPAELGRVATFLLSPAASYVTGASFQVDGGLVTALP